MLILPEVLIVLELEGGVSNPYHEELGDRRILNRSASALSLKIALAPLITSGLSLGGPISPISL